jgi:competence protein ComEA
VRLPWETGNQKGLDRWFAPITIGALIGLVAFLLVLLIRTPRDTVVLEVSRQPDPDQIKVWVGGEVVQPGLYQLRRGSRVSDAIEAAGGLKSGADVAALPMAELVADADEIVVPIRGTAPVIPVAAADPTEPDPLMAEPSSTLININTADARELEALPGIGPAIAARVVEYRDANGAFSTVDELEAVSGISARMVDEFRPYITVGP